MDPGKLFIEPMISIKLLLNSLDPRIKFLDVQLLDDYIWNYDNYGCLGVSGIPSRPRPLKTHNPPRPGPTRLPKGDIPLVSLDEEVEEVEGDIAKEDEVIVMKGPSPIVVYID